MKVSRITLMAALVSVATLSGCASGPRMKQYNVMAKVVKIDAVQECYDKKKGGTGSTLVGALIGGALGNQFGSGNGRKAATIAGALLGAKAGASDRQLDKMRCDRRVYDVTLAYLDPVTRAMVTDIERFERKPRASAIQIPVYRRDTTVSE